MRATTFPFATLLLSVWIAALGSTCRADGADAAPDYAPTDPGLKAVLIDSSERESYLGMACDTAGRLFCGGREALFVWEPDAASETGYGLRQEIYRFPDHTWIYDIAIRGHDLYVLTVSALYLLPDAVVKREGVQPKRLVWGVPLGHVHQCFHGMAIGPEGDIYFAMGDPLWYYGDFNRPDHWGHWTMFSQPEGTRTPYTGVGAVFRCRPDGSELRIVARGLRNPCGLCFDSHWNLFSNDNDHEGLPFQYVPGRLLHVTPQAYFNWPQGWMPSITPDRADLLETMFDGLGRAVPVGQAYYDDTFLPDRLRNNLLVARWCIRGVTNYPITQRGASYKATEEQTLLAGRELARPVSVHVGRGGRIFVTIAYMAHNEGSPTYKSDLVMLTRADDQPPYPFAGYEATEASNLTLLAELSDPSWSQRYRAHIEINRRGGDLANYITARLPRISSDDPGRECMIWLAAAGGSSEARKYIRGLPRDDDPYVRLQAARILDEYGRAWIMGSSAFAEAMNDTDPRVQHAGLVGMMGIGQLFTFNRARELVASKDTYLRQSAALLFAKLAPLEELESMLAAEDAAIRLGGVLAVGFKLTLPAVDAEYPDGWPLAEPRGPEVTFADGESVDLRALGRIGNFTLADHWKVFTRGLEEERQDRLKEQLFSLLFDRLNDTDEAVRLQAAQFLSLLNDPRSEPRVLEVRAQSDDLRLSTAPVKLIERMWVVGPFADGADGFDRLHPPETGPQDVAAEYPIGDSHLAWREASPEGNLYALGAGEAAADASSHFACFRLETAQKQRVHLLVGSDDGIRVRHNGRLVFTNDIARGALPFQDVIPLDLDVGGNDILVRVRNRTGGSGLYAHVRSLGPMLITLPEKLGASELSERLRAAAEAGEGQPIAEEFLSVDWSTTAAAGDPANGKRLFDTIGCGKCHAVTPDSPSTGGPSLADAARRFTVPYLVESILLPSKQLSPIFRATGIVTRDGQSLRGLVVGETAEKLDLLLTDAKRVTLDKSQIEEQQLLDISPMPQGVVKKPDELRDLLAYLLKATQ